MKSLKYIVLSVAFVVLLTSFADAQKTIKAASRISEVVVYPDRALVTRTLTQKVPAGASFVEITGLPGIISDNTVRVKGKSSGNLTVRDVTVKRVFLTDVPEGKVRELENQIEALENEDKFLEAKSNALNEQIRFLTGIKPKSSNRDGEIIKNAGPGELSALNTALGDSLAVAKDENRKIKHQRRDLQKKLNTLRTELRKIKNPQQKVEKSISVEVHASSPSSVNLEVSYIVASASWWPLYDVRADMDKSEVEIIAKADIRQSTGEDWNGVKLSVSTAKPAMGGVLPQMSKWTIDLYRPPPPPAPKPAMAPRGAYKMAAKDEAEMDFDLGAEPEEAMEEEPMMEAETIVAEADYKGTAATFTIPRSFTVPSDGENHRTVISKEKLSSEFVYSTTPKLSSLAYLRARITNKSGHPFISGPASVFMGNTYVGNTSIKAWGPGQEITISLGPDEGIKVTRKEVDRELNEGRKQKLTVTYQIKVENFRKKKITLEVFDHVPVSLNKDIGVDVENILPEPKEHKTNGIMKWEIQLAPGGKTEMSYTITVKYPSDKQISDLP